MEVQKQLSLPYTGLPREKSWFNRKLQIQTLTEAIQKKQ